ncbi:MULTISPECIES: RNA polymerase sigma factor [unclassified Kaistella]|uniref:RNA polymerase sigma factor n=1 Tax=unclassified Kaistella TaxID=2762626 RepID=UPI0027343FFB|nr:MULTISPECIES: sigma-70 family RNA polymerase sigma factor [unclassified Kaistella]MCZ2085432.1 sigma-70 family RNA polymerase sigma factor [Flavobacteriales bacterium]MDP2454565.1 sigma-70 family RNA polymerase sigma factor [Kaistella sp. SH11-4b]MDP2457303.1 sigma-70 family RNA polymerase sigma factor [Kaistella sp. SH40-3]MDP2460063.1 sigma-70 family RNA polymerase sigma factor [Kaistella sp. SH19-2b]
MSSLEKEFLEKIEKHKGVIFKISKMYMDNFEDQKDLFQEITFQVWKAYPTFEGKSQFSTWLYRVALNTAIIFLKSEKKRSFIQNDEVENFKIIADDYDDDQEKKLTVMYKAIQQLNEIDKALIFYYLQDYSGKEIAENMGITEVNARVKLNRAKEKLKQLI